MDVLRNGKQSIALNIRNKQAQDVIYKMSKISDVLVEPYRPGVMEKYGLGPDKLMAINPALIYARLTGFGQTGPLSARAGHDINYAAVSGILSLLGGKNPKPTPPVNLLADFAGGGLLCAFGICTALIERGRTGKGQIIDCSMTEGAAYLGSWLTRSQSLPFWGNLRGKNVLDGEAFYYDTYETLDGKYMSVGALEPQFFKEFINALGLPELMQYPDDPEQAKRQVTRVFATKTQNEWTEIFENLDACVYPVLDWNTAHEYKQNMVRKSFVDPKMINGTIVPIPAPILSRTPATSSVLTPTVDYMKMVENICNEIGLTNDDIKLLYENKALYLPDDSKL